MSGGFGNGFDDSPFQAGHSQNSIPYPNRNDRIRSAQVEAARLLRGPDARARAFMAPNQASQSKNDDVNSVLKTLRSKCESQDSGLKQGVLDQLLCREVKKQCREEAQRGQAKVRQLETEVVTLKRKFEADREQDGQAMQGFKKRIVELEHEVMAESAEKSQIKTEHDSAIKKLQGGITSLGAHDVRKQAELEKLELEVKTLKEWKESTTNIVDQVNAANEKSMDTKIQSLRRSMTREMEVSIRVEAKQQQGTIAKLEARVQELEAKEAKNAAALSDISAVLKHLMGEK